MRIAVCDDDEPCRRTVISYITDFCAASPDLEMSVDVFCCGEDLLEAYQSGKDFDFLFLDIQMKKINGIETAQELRKSNKHVIIFFITGFTQYVSAAFTLNAFQFLVKPLRKESFDREFRRAVSKYFNDHEKYPIESKSRTIALEVGKIAFLETSNHHIIIHTETNEYVKQGKLNDEEKKLAPYGFIKTHHGILVNMSFIFEINQDDIIMKDGSKVMLSIRRRSDVLQAFNKFLRGHSI